MMRTDLLVHADVSTSLRRQLGPVAAGYVDVLVRDGMVTLTGTVESVAHKRIAERAAQQVAGIRAVAEELHVVGADTSPPDDASLAKAVVDALEMGCGGAGRQINVRVEDGWVALNGQVASATEYTAVQRALECLPGVRGKTREVRVTVHTKWAPAPRPGTETV
jgi:osmotically-inducible protein OsmY